MSESPRRTRPVPPELADKLGWRPNAGGEAQLAERLDRALDGLPSAERAAAVVAFGLDEGAAGVAAELGLSPDDAEALTRSVVQLLRAALVEPPD